MRRPEVAASWVPLRGDAMALKTGTSLMHLRDAAHGGFKTTGDTSLVLFTAHIVDKGKPPYDAPE